jgi:DNA-binding beta-propeller fold protein YncE
MPLSRTHRGRRSAGWLITAALACVVAAFSPPASHAREPLDVDLFARVPDPGLPEGIAVGPDGLVYVGTSPKDGNPLTRKPSKVFAYNSHGTLVHEYTIRGQDLTDPGYGLLGMAFDGDGLLYALDARPPRVVTLDPRTGTQHEYARFSNVPSCQVPGTAGRCSATVGDLNTFPDYPVFAPDGTLYVTDLFQALIWRIPRGGGTAQVWFTDPRLESLFGPNGIAFLPDGRTLVFALTTQGNPAAGSAPAGLYKLPVRPNGAPGGLSLLWESRMDDGPDGFAIGASGKFYVALSNANAVAVVSPHGTELARTPSSQQENEQMEVPFDAPASVAFLGNRALVTNHAFISRNPEHFAVLDVFAGEPGRPLFRPRIRARAHHTAGSHR